MSSGTRVSAPEIAHQSLQLARQPASLAPFSNLDARAPPGHQDRGLELSRLPQIRERLQQREIRLAVRGDADHAQRVAMTEIGPGAVAHDEEPAPDPLRRVDARTRSEEHTSELQSQSNLVCRLLLEKKKQKRNVHHTL